MRSLDSAKQFMLSARGVCLSQYAAAGALLTCVAIILNVGPFVAQGVDRLPGSAVQKEALALTGPTLASVSNSAVDMGVSTESDFARPAPHTVEASQPVRHWLQWASL